MQKLTSVDDEWSEALEVLVRRYGVDLAWRLERRLRGKSKKSRTNISPP